MTPQDVLELPHTADEALDVLRAFDPAKANDIADRTIRVRVTGPGIDLDAEAQALQACSRQLARFARWEAVDALKPIADATPMLSHKSCRSVAVIAPRWRKLRDRTALDLLLSRVAAADPSTGPAIDLHPEAFGADEHTDTLTESPPLSDRHEPAALRGPPATQPMPMGASWAAGTVREGQSDTAAARHTTSSAWDLLTGGERT